MTKRWPCHLGILLVSVPFLLAGTAGCVANTQVSSSPEIADEEKVDPEAVAALTAMGNYLNSLKTFAVTSEMSLDEVLLSGQKILVTGTTRFEAAIPDRLKVTSKIDEIHRDSEYYYDGKTFTLYSRRDNYYASFDAPGNIRELLDVAEEEYDIVIPLRDLFYWGTQKERSADLQSAIVIDSSEVRGTPCTHYAFRQEDVDWQLWIENDDTPLPRKLVITSKHENGQPQYISTMTWETDPRLAASTFVFTPPEGAHRIDFAIYEDETEPVTTK